MAPVPVHPDHDPEEPSVPEDAWSPHPYERRNLGGRRVRYSFAPIGGAHRFAREFPGSELVAIESAGHCAFDQEPERCRAEILRFLASPGRL